MKYFKQIIIVLSIGLTHNVCAKAGSLSVNVHGRDALHAQIIDTVESIKIMCADGCCMTASRCVIKS